eukprot:262686-Chlamydomonas_euryale.AAC.15
MCCTDTRWLLALMAWYVSCARPCGDGMGVEGVRDTHSVSSTADATSLGQPAWNHCGLGLTVSLA